ncbi:Crp/Fnr family transcriptional regulator [Rubellimicrobium rubrum]|uniref:Crp/Fnr family transcriptional regulator n=1 Tax=Rubellimicrobium rubrum TaxID=2585369 RepID=A0A5C4MRX5_9RHOB|nr:Crp/Fnr family transcriptional regulator [Rubellimicrobium rubrum]TNC48544.1 Crp/Fnr family transcriptional regulator [Rubellimicrobium rubrum]
MRTAHPLIARLEREIVLTPADRLSVNEVPFYLQDFKAGEGPSWAGDQPRRSFVILEGLLSTSKTMRDGEVQITAFHIPGDMPDLQSLHLEVLDCDIGALSNCVLAFMAHSDLRGFCERHPRLAAALWRSTLVDGAIYREWVVNVARRQALGRLAHLFCEMMARMEAAGLAAEGTCALALTQAGLSEATGLSHVHVNRTLQDLRARGLVSFGQGQLTIHDWDALARLGEFTPDYLHLRSAAPAL